MTALWTAYRTLRELHWRLVGPTTLGSRCLLLRGNEILLVRHRYEPWWYFPGGGLKRGESFAEAAHREVWEEQPNLIRFMGRTLGPAISRVDGH